MVHSSEKTRIFIMGKKKKMKYSPVTEKKLSFKKNIFKISPLKNP